MERGVSKLSRKRGTATEPTATQWSLKKGISVTGGQNVSMSLGLSMPEEPLRAASAEALLRRTLSANWLAMQEQEHGGPQGLQPAQGGGTPRNDGDELPNDNEANLDVIRETIRDIVE